MKEMFLISTSAALSLLTASFVAEAADLPIKAAPGPVVAQVSLLHGAKLNVEHSQTTKIPD